MKRRHFLGLVGAGTIQACLPRNKKSFSGNSTTATTIQHPVSGHFFPALPFDYDALEPYIDAATMQLHYQHHHRNYFKTFTDAIDGTPLETTSMREIFRSISTQNETIRNNGGGYYNHLLFWDNLSQDGGQPAARLLNRIIRQYKSFDTFKETFNQMATSIFGSGWAWLILNQDNELDIVSTSNQDNPLMDTVSKRGIPLLAIDVWEHAYYLKYKNNRTTYVENFWQVINWKSVNKRFLKALKGEWLG
jgi:Fe-Mn family superoxide dismutase